MRKSLLRSCSSFWFSLLRSEAVTRSALLASGSPLHYNLFLNFKPGETYSGSVCVDFALSDAAIDEPLFIEYNGEELHSV